MDPLLHASTLNNLGVYLLESNNTLGAIEMFQKVVRLLKESVVISPITTTTTTTATTTTTTSYQRENFIATANESHLHQQFPPYNTPEQQCSTQLHHHHPSSSSSTATNSTIMLHQPTMALCRPGTKLDPLNQQSEYYIFDRALLLPSNLSAQFAAGDSSSNDVVDMSTFIASTIAIFNFAIACHSHGIHHTQTSSLHQSIQLYQLTLRMIQEANVEQDNFLKVIMCLSLNNMANIFYQLLEYGSSAKCVSCMDEILKKNNPNNAIDASALEFICETEWAELKINLFILQSPSAAHAA